MYMYVDYLDFCEGQHNSLLFILCWIVWWYHRIRRIKETEMNEGHFGGTSGVDPEIFERGGPEL